MIHNSIVSVFSVGVKALFSIVYCLHNSFLLLFWSCFVFESLFFSKLVVEHLYIFFLSILYLICVCLPSISFEMLFACYNYIVPLMSETKESWSVDSLSLIVLVPKPIENATDMTNGRFFRSFSKDIWLNSPAQPWICRDVFVPWSSCFTTTTISSLSLLEVCGE